MSSNKYKKIFDSLTDFVALVRKDYSILESNRAADVVLNGGARMVGLNCHKTFRGKEEPCHDCPLAATLKSGQVIPLENYDERFDEYFEERTYPITNGAGELESFVLIGRNVTKTRELGEKYAQAKKLAALGQISSGVAHDFNNMLTGVLGRVQLMKRQVDDEQVLKNLEMIETAALDGAATVRRMQDFARSRKDVMATTISLTELVNDVIALTKPRWKEDAEIKGIIIEPVVDIREEPFVHGDPSDIRNAFTNVIFNALDAMPEGGVLTVRTDKKGEKAIVEFVDTGIGMTEETIDRIFDPFFSTKGVKGNGLGMSEVYGVVKRHGGTIDVESRVGKGTKIRFTFPLALKDTEEGDIDEELDGEPCKVLVIDDEEYILDILKDLLKEFGHDVMASSSPENGLELFRKSDYDIVITDLGMPEMSGWEVAEHIKKLHPDTPVILLTGWALSLDKEKIKENGVDFTLHKPFAVEEIKRVISEARKLMEQN